MQFPSVKGLTSHQYTVAIRLTPHQSLSTELQLHQQSARTCGSSTAKFLSSKLELINWNEVFFFKVDSPVCRYFFFFHLLTCSFEGCFFKLCCLFMSSHIFHYLSCDHNKKRIPLKSLYFFIFIPDVCQ